MFRFKVSAGPLRILQPGSCHVLRKRVCFVVSYARYMYRIDRLGYRGSSLLHCNVASPVVTYTCYVVVLQI